MISGAGVGSGETAAADGSGSLAAEGSAAVLSCCPLASADAALELVAGVASNSAALFDGIQLLSSVKLASKNRCKLIIFGLHPEEERIPAIA